MCMLLPRSVVKSEEIITFGVNWSRVKLTFLVFYGEVPSQSYPHTVWLV